MIKVLSDWNIQICTCNNELAVVVCGADSTAWVVHGGQWGVEGVLLDGEGAGGTVLLLGLDALLVEHHGCQLVVKQRQGHKPLICRRKYLQDYELKT